MFKRLLLMKQIPASRDYALLWLRVGCFLALFLKHGLPKLAHYPGNMHSFFDPIHIGPMPSLLISTFSDFICSILIIVGLATRWSALFVFVNIFVAWAFQQHFLFFAHEAAHGELMVLYLVVSLMLFIGGRGQDQRRRNTGSLDRGPHVTAAQCRRLTFKSDGGFEYRSMKWRQDLRG